MKNKSLNEWKMSMNEAFIWLSGLRFIDQKILLMAKNFFWIFTENILDVNWF